MKYVGNRISPVSSFMTIKCSIFEKRKLNVENKLWICKLMLNYSITEKSVTVIFFQLLVQSHLQGWTKANDWKNDFKTDLAVWLVSISLNKVLTRIEDGQIEVVSITLLPPVNTYGEVTDGASGEEIIYHQVRWKLRLRFITNEDDSSSDDEIPLDKVRNMECKRDKLNIM